jgi:glycosyltransferase involved in cell wall biosynthesis
LVLEVEIDTLSRPHTSHDVIGNGMSLVVGVVGPELPDSFAENIVTSLRRMGHRAELLGSIYPFPGSAALSAGVDLARKVSRVDVRLQKRVVKRVRLLRPHLVINVEGAMLPETVEAIRSSGSSIVLWFPDHISNLGRLLMFVAPYNALFFKEPSLVDTAQRLMDTPVHYLPEACNPEWHRPVDGDEPSPYVVVAGSLYPWRVRLLERLIAEGVELRIFGSGLPRWLQSPQLEASFTGRYLSRLDKAREFRRAGVVLNSLHPSEIKGVNCRLFEAAGCGAALLSEWRDELPTFFEIDNEITTYGSFEELVAKIRWMLSHPAECRKRGDAASTRAHAEHNYENRLMRLIGAL